MTGLLKEEAHEIDQMQKELDQLKLLMKYEKEHFKGLQEALRDHEAQESKVN